MYTLLMKFIIINLPILDYPVILAIVVRPITNNQHTMIQTTATTLTTIEHSTGIELERGAGGINGNTEKENKEYLHQSFIIHTCST